ncbi:hypothetical protein [Chryseobacterium sp. sg2396]|uniref:hypothetical protein n=1 Tax=Chryseobacterium sp. sg2396 TaxID=3276280 RepID=UPI003673559D
MIKKPSLNIMQQYAALKRDYNYGDIKIIGDRLIWEGKLKSSPIGDEYLIKISYKKNDVPKIFVLQPENLKLPEGKNRLMHVYDHEKQRLCLYYPDAKEWTNKKTIASTILPWAIEWLYHYEIWLITGNWTGGGIHPSDEKDKSEIK